MVWLWLVTEQDLEQGRAVRTPDLGLRAPGRACPASQHLGRCEAGKLGTSKAAVPVPGGPLLTLRSHRPSGGLGRTLAGVGRGCGLESAPSPGAFPVSGVAACGACFLPFWMSQLLYAGIFWSLLIAGGTSKSGAPPSGFRIQPVSQPL